MQNCSVNCRVMKKVFCLYLDGGEGVFKIVEGRVSRQFMTPPHGSEAVTSFCWVSVHVSAYVIWLYSENSGKFSKKLVGLFLTSDPRHGTRAV